MLIIPTTIKKAYKISEAVSLSKGQVYNLDTNEFIGFQFNPKDFIWSRQFHYNNVTWKGSNSGGDVEFLYSGPKKMDLTLLYIADPGSPEISYNLNVNEEISTPSLKMDFQVILDTLDRWTDTIPDKGRPSRLKIIMGPNGFNCIVTSTEVRISETFSDLSVREGYINLRVREWTETIKIQ